VLKDFKDFVLESDFVALATGLIVGAAVGKVVSSLVNDLFMPLVGAALGKVTFTSMSLAIPGTTSIIRYGSFITVLIDTVVVLAVVFLIIRGIEKLKRTEEAQTRDCPYCMTEIADQATRCPSCTSELGGAAVEAEAAEPA
jgi:large conductance mechanosensitive channel